MTQQVLLVDGCQIFRMGMREAIRMACPQAVVTEAATFADAYAVLKGDCGTTLVMLDSSLPDCDGFIGLFQLCNEFPTIPVVLVADRADDASTERATEFGAAGIVLKSSSCMDIVNALTAIIRGKKWTSPPVALNDNDGEIGAMASLSPAQFRILAGLQRGLRNKQIAYEMGVTEKTVKAYTTTMYRKLGVSSRTQALILARKTFAG